ncbi:MAG TPA: HAMP domain-containing sensor histidine kinase [Mycobacteriales bacterium]|nr:HAMP domain-containing sensor histidine kinase [Mycobacteriales bacterium]
MRPRASLATRIGLVTVGAAALAVLVAGALALGLVRSAAESQARRTLGRFAALAAAPSAGRGTARTGEAALRRLQVQFVPVRADGVQLRGAQLPADILAAVKNGAAVDQTRRLGTKTFLVEARPSGAQITPVLLQPTSTVAEISNPLGERIFLALAIGLGAAALAGVLLARRLAAPLTAAAAAAHRLSAGERSVRVRPDGPAEVAQVAESLNALAGALESSEQRQRAFLLSVSHELRTPLTGIRGYAEALADGLVDDIPGAAGIIRTEADRLERLVADLLDLARLGADDFRVDLAPVDLAALVEDAGRIWSRRCADAGIVLRVEAVAVVVRTDPLRVRQILDGLAENALRVTPSGSPIVFAVRPGNTGGAVLQVRDGGPGLADEDLMVAFEQGTLHARYRGVRPVGTGLGLALVAGLAGRLGGHALAGHAGEGGASFTVTLPD